MNHGTTTSDRNLASLLADFRNEIGDFFQTRIFMLKTELQGKLKNLKTAAVLAVAGIMLLGTAYLLFTLALVGLIVAAFPTSIYRWFFAFLAVAIFWALFGAMAAYFAKRELELRGILPKRTIEVLKGDKVWVHTEVTSQI